MKEILIVFLGGGLGSALRYGFSKWLNHIQAVLPFGTLIANTLACIIFGIVTGYIYTKLELQPITKLFILTGICGGLSTFSTLNFEIVTMVKNGQIAFALSYLILSFVLCLGTLFLTINGKL